MFRAFLSLYMTLMMIFGVVDGSPFKNRNLEREVTQYLERKGVVGYLYDGNGGFFYTASDPWQRIFGYNNLYDAAAPLAVMYYDTEKFDFEYDGKDWRIQFWKGQYGWIFIGGEIGIYTKPRARLIEQYSCAGEEDWLEMSFEMTRFNRKKLFSIPHESRWWCTGFVPGNLIITSWRDQLKMDCVLTMKDEEMLSIFTDVLQRRGYSYTARGLDVYMQF